MKALVIFRQGACGNLKAYKPILNRFRSFSSQDERHPPKLLFHVEVASTRSSFVWPETKLGVLEPKDSRFPLPGLVGSDAQKKTLSPTKPNYEADVLTSEQNHERQSSVLEQFLAINEKSKAVNGIEFSDVFERYTYFAEECPFFLKKDLHDIFPAANLLHKTVTIVNVFLKEGNDVVSDSDGSQQFDEAAYEICESFQKVGFWADFIDPNEKPYFGMGLNDRNSYETEKRYRSLAVKLQVYAGCTLIAHKKDSKFVGCLVTTAPVHHPLILSLIELFES